MSRNREQENEYRARVFAARNEPVVQTIQMLLDLGMEKVKTALLTAVPEDVRRLQGRAEAFKEMAKWISDPVQTGP